MKNKNQQGVTVIEMLIILAVFSIISAAIYGFISISLRAQTKSFAEIEAATNARKAIFSMSDNIRNTIQSATGSYPIQNASNQSLTFFANIDQDPDIERIRYFLSGSDLRMGVIQPQGIPVSYPEASEQISTIARFIRNGADPIFYYYDKDYTGTQAPLNPSDIGNIRLIKIVLVADSDPNRNPPATTMETKVQLRNLKDNL